LLKPRDQGRLSEIFGFLEIKICCAVPSMRIICVLRTGYASYAQMTKAPNALKREVPYGTPTTECPNPGRTTSRGRARQVQETKRQICRAGQREWLKALKWLAALLSVFSASL
jgi:hypothetical protein